MIFDWKITNIFVEMVSPRVDHSNFSIKNLIIKNLTLRQLKKVVILMRRNEKKTRAVRKFYFFFKLLKFDFFSILFFLFKTKLSALWYAKTSAWIKILVQDFKGVVVNSGMILLLLNFTRQFSCFLFFALLWWYIHFPFIVFPL